MHKTIVKSQGSLELANVIIPHTHQVIKKSFLFFRGKPLAEARGWNSKQMRDLFEQYTIRNKEQYELRTAVVEKPTRTERKPSKAKNVKRSRFSWSTM